MLLLSFRCEREESRARAKEEEAPYPGSGSSLALSPWGGNSVLPSPPFRQRGEGYRVKRRGQGKAKRMRRPGRRRRCSNLAHAPRDSFPFALWQGSYLTHLITHLITAGASPLRVCTRSVRSNGLSSAVNCASVCAAALLRDLLVPA